MIPLLATYGPGLLATLAIVVMVWDHWRNPVED